MSYHPIDTVRDGLASIDEALDALDALLQPSATTDLLLDDLDSLLYDLRDTSDPKIPLCYDVEELICSVEKLRTSVDKFDDLRAQLLRLRQWLIDGEHAYDRRMIEERATAKAQVAKNNRHKRDLSCVHRRGMSE